MSPGIDVKIRYESRLDEGSGPDRLIVNLVLVADVLSDGDRMHQTVDSVNMIGEITKCDGATEKCVAKALSYDLERAPSHEFCRIRTVDLGVYSDEHEAALAIEDYHQIHAHDWPHLGWHKNWATHAHSTRTS